MARKAFSTHEQYIDDAAPEAQDILREIQALVEARVPGSTRCISYGMPAFRKGKVFFYFAAFKQHIGIYPPVKADTKLIEKLRPYRGDKGNLSFALDKTIPFALIGRVAVALAKEYAPTVNGKAKA